MCFRIVFTTKSDSFQRRKDNELHTLLLLVMARHQYGACHIQYIYSVVFRFVYFLLGFVRTSLLINEIDSTLSFYY